MHGGHGQLAVIVLLLAEQQPDARPLERAGLQPVAGDGAQPLDRLIDQLLTMREDDRALAGTLEHLGQERDEDHGLAGAGGRHAQHVGVVVPGREGLGDGVGLVVAKLHL